MIDLDAHRRILAWAVATNKMVPAEYNYLLGSIKDAERRTSQCEGKTAFDSFEFVNKIAGRSAGRHAHGISVYRCQICGKWHAGIKKPKSSNRTLTLGARR